MNYNYIAEMIKNLRKQFHMTQIELANKSGVSQTTISRLENIGNNGKLDLQFDTLEKICDVLSISSDDLIAGSLEYNETEADNVLFSNNRLDMRLQRILFPNENYPCRITTLIEFLAFLPIIGEERILELYNKYDYDFVKNSKAIIHDISVLVDDLNPNDSVVKHAKYLLDCICAVRYNKPCKENCNEQDYIDYLVWVENKICAIKSIKQIGNEVNILNKDFASDCNE